MLGNAHTLFLIGFDGSGLDIPAGIACGTGVELGFRQFVMPLARHFGRAADALQPTPVALVFHADIVRLTGLAGEVIGQRFTLNQRTVLLEGETVSRGNGFAGLVVIRPVGIEGCPVAFDNDIALRAYLDLRLPFYLVGDNSRVVFGHRPFAASFDGRFGFFGFAAFVTAKQAGRTEAQVGRLHGFGHAPNASSGGRIVRFLRRNGIGGGAMRAEAEAQCQHQWFE